MPPTPIPARKAVVGVVYLSPKGRELRVEKVGSSEVTVFRLATGDTVPIDVEYLLTPKEAAPVVAPAVAPTVPPHVDAVAGRGRDVLQPWIQGQTPPVPTEADLDALLAADTRSWVSFEVGLERERRALAVQAAGSPVVEAIVDTLGGVVEAVEPVTESAAATGEEQPAAVILAPVQTDAPISTEGADPTIGTASGSDAVMSAGGDASSDDDLPWDASEGDDRPLTLPGEPVTAPPAAPVVVGAAPVDVAPVVAPVVEPAPAPAPEPAAETKPAKERPRGYCPACAQLLTVRADGTMMQHYTPDGRKVDGKRVDCQGVGLAPRSEQPPIDRLTLPEAMGVTVSVSSTVGADPARVMAALSEGPAVLASHPVPVDVEAPADARPDDVVEPVRYTLGGSDEAGWCIIDLRSQRALTYMGLDGGTAPALFATEDEARQVLDYVREHGDLPDGDATAAIDAAADAETARIVAEELIRAAAARLPPEAARTWVAMPANPMAFPSDYDHPPAAPAVPVAPARDYPPIEDPITALSRMVEDAKARGVRVRIVIEPIE